VSDLDPYVCHRGSASLNTPGAIPASQSRPNEEVERYEGTNNVYCDFESLKLVDPSIDLGPNQEEIREELLTHEPSWLRELEKKFLTGDEKSYQYEQKMNMQLILAHDQLHAVHKNITCSVYDDYQPAYVDEFLTGIQLWSASHFKTEYNFDEEKSELSKESPIFKFCIVEWPHYLSLRYQDLRTIPKLQDLCPDIIQKTLGTSQEFQLYRVLLKN